MCSTATDEVDEAIVAGLWSDDPAVWLLARQAKINSSRVTELEAENAELTTQVKGLSEQVKRLRRRSLS